MFLRPLAVLALSSVSWGCSPSPFPLLAPPDAGDSGGARVDDTASPEETGVAEDTGAVIDPAWLDPASCEANTVVYEGLDETCAFRSFAWVSPDEGGIVVRAAMTEPGGPTACDLFSTEPATYERQPLIINIWAGEGNTLGPAEVTMEEAQEEAPPPPDTTEPDGLGSDAVVRIESGERLRSINEGETYSILHYEADGPLVVDETFRATFEDGSSLVPGGWVACHCPTMVAFGSE